MGKSHNSGKASPLEKRGGYESGSKKATELAPPPKGPGAGVKPAPAENTKK